MLELRALKIAEGSRLRHKLPRRFADSDQRKSAQGVYAMDTPLPRQTAANWTVKETDTVYAVAVKNLGNEHFAHTHNINAS